MVSVSDNSAIMCYLSFRLFFAGGRWLSVLRALIHCPILRDTRVLAERVAKVRLLLAEKALLFPV